jgi:carboxyl-terminal processing protease
MADTSAGHPPLPVVNASMRQVLLPVALLLSAAAAPTLLSSSPAAPRPAPQDVEALLSGQLERAARTPADQLWALALGLREAAKLLPEGSLDRALTARLSASGGAAPAARLVLAAASLAGQTPDLPLLQGTLLELIDGPDGALAESAAQLFARPSFRGLEREARTALSNSLLDRARDAKRDAGLRMACADAAHFLGGGTERRLARAELLAFMESGDAGVRGRAALGLAAIGEVVEGRLEAELARLEALPGPEAQLAAGYLRSEKSKRLWDRKLRELQGSQSSGTLPPELTRFQAVMRMIEGVHLEGDQRSRDELVDAALEGMLGSMDEHSSYLPAKAYAGFVQDLEAEYGGIGAYVGIDPADNLFTITRPIYSGPAYKAGLQTDDKIVRVDDWPTLGHPAEDVIKRLKGKPGTDVSLYIWRRGMDAELIDRPSEEMRIEIRRAQIEIPAVHAQMLPGGIGLIELTTFSRVAADELAAAIRDLSTRGLTGLILDLRRNSGGLLDEAVEVDDLFLPPDQLVARTEYRDHPAQEYRTQREPLVPMEMPLVVLISRFSASASEIVAGSLQDHGRAVLIGERSYGKGSVQNLFPVDGIADDQFIDENKNRRHDPWERITLDHDKDGEFDYAPRVKLTIARYLLPSGRSIHRELDREGNLLSQGGVEPDRAVALPRIEAWRWEERLRVRDSLRAAKTYVEERFQQHQALFTELAECDQRDTNRWPDFDTFYAGLSTPLPPDDVRLLLRAEVRRRIQDVRGGEFPIGDFQEDTQVQAGVREVLERTGRSPADFADYQTTFQALEEAVSDWSLVAAQNGGREGLRAAAERLREARALGQSVDPTDIDSLLSALGYLSEKSTSDGE